MSTDKKTITNLSFTPCGTPIFPRMGPPNFGPELCEGWRKKKINKKLKIIVLFFADYYIAKVKRDNFGLTKAKLQLKT